MDELINLVATKTGLPADKARVAVDTVLGYVKEKLPAPIDAQLDGLMGGGSASKEAGGLGDTLGGLFKRG